MEECSRTAYPATWPAHPNRGRRWASTFRSEPEACPTALITDCWQWDAAESSPSGRQATQSTMRVHLLVAALLVASAAVAAAEGKEPKITTKVSAPIRWGRGDGGGGRTVRRREGSSSCLHSCPDLP